MSSRLVRWGKSALIFLLILGIALILLEGLSSAVIFGYQLAFDRNPGLQSRTHVRYDETLGWVNIPNLRLDDMYGAGRDFVSNDRSFRNDHPFDVATPPGRLRLICSGDSFTLGIGVSNEDTFCATLEAIEPRLETANLGEAGYGIGQVYLKYEKLSLFIRRNDHIWSGVRTLDLARRIKAKLLAPAKAEPGRKLEDDEALRITLRVFEEVGRVIGEELEGRGMMFIDLVEEFRNRAPHEQQELFDSRWNHYTVEGNRRVAQLILARLRADPRSAAVRAPAEHG